MAKVGRMTFANQGSQGIVNLHPDRIVPQQPLPRRALSRADKQANRALAQPRVEVEHGIRRLKRLRILSERSRNRRKRFSA